MIDSELICLLSIEDQNNLKSDIDKYGYDDIKTLRSHLQKNLNSNDYTLIDADLIITFDLHTNYSIFITENEIFNKEEVIKKFNLSAFNIEPEQLFNNQKIEVIDSDYFIFDSECENRNPQKLYNTKIYIGKEKWKDFMISFRFMRSLSFISKSRLSIADSKEEKIKENEYINNILDRVLND